MYMNSNFKQKIIQLMATLILKFIYCVQDYFGLILFLPKSPLYKILPHF